VQCDDDWLAQSLSRPKLHLLNIFCEQYARSLELESQRDYSCSHAAAARRGWTCDANWWRGSLTGLGQLNLLELRARTPTETRQDDEWDEKLGGREAKEKAGANSNPSRVHDKCVGIAFVGSTIGERCVEDAQQSQQQVRAEWVSSLSGARGCRYHRLPPEVISVASIELPFPTIFWAHATATLGVSIIDAVVDSLPRDQVELSGCPALHCTVLRCTD